MRQNWLSFSAICDDNDNDDNDDRNLCTLVHNSNGDADANVLQIIFICLSTSVLCMLNWNLNLRKFAKILLNLWQTFTPSNLPNVCIYLSNMCISTATFAIFYWEISSSFRHSEYLLNLPFFWGKIWPDWPTNRYLFYL